METREIKCPCCSALIVINSESGQILKFEAAKKKTADFGDFIEKQKSRKEDLARKFEEAKEKSKTRLASIAEKIQYKKDHLDEEIK